MLPLIDSLINSTIGKVVDKALNLLPLSQVEKEKLNLEIIKIMTEEQKELNSQIEIINNTIREEIKSDKFLVYSWRPFIGYIFVITIFVNYVIGAFIDIPKIEVPETIWWSMGSILGISAAGRSIEKILKINKK